MSSDVMQLAAEVSAATGAALPAILEDNSPALRSQVDESFYLVGLIGGKEVGKSALVNALVGEQISESTSYGPGTETVVAYAHEDQAQRVRQLLQRDAPNRHRIITHSLDSLRRQVLLDLPDIDSQYDDHIELTRRMLRHMLYPIWVQSIEKYADQQPQKLLAAVAAGNDPANFLFCLNKCDQLADAAALGELREDYALRVAKAIGRIERPRVFVVSAMNPDAFDLPLLRRTLAQEKEVATVRQSIQLAGRQRERSVLAWLDEQRLPERALRLKRLEDEAAELAAGRLLTPLLERTVPRILDDSAHRAAIVDEVLSARVARWPVVNLLHTLLLPVTSLWRQNIGAGPTPEALVGASIDDDAGRTLCSRVQATFALLQQTHPQIGTIYRQQKLWEAMPADAAAEELRRTLVASLERQRAFAMSKLARRGFLMPLVRWILTVGAILWFPIAQPILEAVLAEGYAQTIRHIALLAVQLLGATYLLKSAAFLGIWFLVLWLMLRWNTQRRVTRLLLRWRRADGSEPSINLAAAVAAWVDELLDPIHLARQREETLSRRADDLKQQLVA